MYKRKNQERKEKLARVFLLALIVLGIGYVGHSDYEVKVLEAEAGISTFNN